VCYRSLYLLQVLGWRLKTSYHGVLQVLVFVAGVEQVCLYPRLLVTVPGVCYPVKLSLGKNLEPTFVLYGIICYYKINNLLHTNFAQMQVCACFVLCTSVFVNDINKINEIFAGVLNLRNSRKVKFAKIRPPWISQFSYFTAFWTKFHGIS